MSETVVIKRTIVYTVKIPIKSYGDMSETAIRQYENDQGLNVDLLSEIEMADSSRVETVVTFE